MSFCVYCSKWCHNLDDCNLNTPHYHNIGSYGSHCPHLSKMNLVYDILPVCSISTLILSSHLPLGLPSGLYHNTTPTHFSTNAFHSGCHVCVSISITTYIKESSNYILSFFVQYRSLQLFNCTVTSHNLADVCTKCEM